MLSYSRSWETRKHLEQDFGLKTQSSSSQSLQINMDFLPQNAMDTKRLLMFKKALEKFDQRKIDQGKCFWF